MAYYYQNNQPEKPAGCLPVIVFVFIPIFILAIARPDPISPVLLYLMFALLLWGLALFLNSWRKKMRWPRFSSPTSMSRITYQPPKESFWKRFPFRRFVLVGIVLFGGIPLLLVSVSTKQNQAINAYPGIVCLLVAFGLVLFLFYRFIKWMTDPARQKMGDALQHFQASAAARRQYIENCRIKNAQLFADLLFSYLQPTLGRFSKEEYLELASKYLDGDFSAEQVEFAAQCIGQFLLQTHAEQQRQNTQPPTVSIGGLVQTYKQKQAEIRKAGLPPDMRDTLCALLDETMDERMQELIQNKSF